MIHRIELKREGIKRLRLALENLDSDAMRLLIEVDNWTSRGERLRLRSPDTYQEWSIGPSGGA